VSGSYRGMSGSKDEGVDLFGGGARVLVLTWGSGGGGMGSVVVPVGGTDGRVGAGACGWGAAATLCDRSRRDAWTGESLQSKAAVVGRVATIPCKVPNWVVMVSS